MKQCKLILPLLLTALMVMISGCSTGKSSKEELVSAMTKMQELKTYTVQGEFGLDEFSVPTSGIPKNAQTAAMIAGMLKGTTITFHGSVQAEPRRTEMTMDVKLGGSDLSFNLSVPIIMTDEKLWFKMPQIPVLQQPETVAGKFVEVDLKKIAKEQGQNLQALDTAKTQQMVQDMAKTLMDNLDEKTYFSEVKAADVKGLPEGLNQDKLVRFAITPANFETALTAIVDTVAPQWIDQLLQNESYIEALGLKKEELEKAKDELAGKGDGEFKKGLEELKKGLKINELSFTGAIKDDDLVYQSLIGNVDLTNEGETMKLGLHFNSQYDNLDDKVKFEYDIPTDAVPVEELQSLLGAASGF